MQTLHFTINISASAEKIWDVLLGKETYPMWTKAFHSDSNVIGNWEQGSAMRFVGTNEDGTQSGMLSIIETHVPNKHIAIKHIGMIMNGIEDTTSEEVQKWAPSYEKYTVENHGDHCTLLVDMDSHEDYVTMFTTMWQRAVVAIKTMSEMQVTPAVVVSTMCKQPLATTWDLFTGPEHIMQWNQASSDWCTKAAVNDLRVGGKFSSIMAAKDGSASFDFNGVYTAVEPQSFYAYTMEDGRKVITMFNDQDGVTAITTIFEPETINSPELQVQGWQAILQSFCDYAEKEV
jgi:uncharacterized protein YndB with AHSA1/START domain